MATMKRRASEGAVKKLRITEGKGRNQFAPNDKTTRAEAVTILLRMLAQKGM
ncbi:S-layer homology domain-containing protein [Paenibacillus chibensis]|uniref:S-layer homology domain-containing protein n=1 Tax=Paenibacillus chibensis TaxID=59846 RepID=A0ABU6Q1F6_9BACL|nr:S-layer homology domain-containing protein [Paenibacillus chibensis]